MSNSSVPFEIDRFNGLLKLAHNLDRELSHAYKFETTACVEEINCDRCQVEVEILDLIDNRPLFDKEVYNETIREDALPGTVVLTVLASDPDLNSRVEYFILEGDTFNQFAISFDGKIYTRLGIDKELTELYELTIVAFDGRFKSAWKVFIRVLTAHK